MLCLFGCKDKHFLSMKPTFLATKSSCISNSTVRGRKLADFLSLLPLFLRRARSFCAPAPSLSLCAPPFVPVLFARPTHSSCSRTRLGTSAPTQAPAHCALSDFPFFAFTPPLYPLDMLRFVGEGFVFPDFFTGEARIHPPSSHLTCYSSAICLLWVKREGKKRKVPDAHACACA